jgi:hypothetical protein
MISKCYADAVDDQFQQICSGSTLPSQSVRQLVESGFVVVPGPVSGDPFNELTAAYDEVMAVATGPDFKIASATTRMSDLLTYASVFHDVYLYPPLLEACSHEYSPPKEATQMSYDVKYIGMDVHKEAIVIAVLNEGGKVVMESIIETKASSILQFLHGLRGELHVTWEEGTWAAWLYDLLQPQVQHIVVCNPRRNALLKEGSKSDKVDARKLADLLRTGMLRPVYHGENGLRTLRELGRSYQTISKDLTLADLTRAIDKNGLQAFEQVADGNAATNLFAATQGGPLSAPAAAIAASIFRPDPRMATPYSQQANAGAEYLLAKSLTLRADYLFVHGVKLPRTLNVNLLPPVVLTPENAPSLAVPAPTPQQIGREVFLPGRLNPNFDDIYALQTSSNSTYNGASLTLSRKMNEELEFSASYTLSKTYDDASDYDEQPQNPFNLRAENALSGQHQQQRFVFNALWDLPIGEEEDKGGNPQGNTGWLTQTFSHIELAPILTLESGRPADPLTGLDSNRSHAFPLSARPLALVRNSLNTPALATMDFRVLKYFPFGAAKRLDVVAEVFNLFNGANVSQINPVFGSGLTPTSGFRQPIAGTGARQIQFSLDFEF